MQLASAPEVRSTIAVNVPEESTTGAMERLFRERRLLLGVSLVLVAHQLLGITVGKGAETLGLHFDIDNPDRLWLGVWMIWLWAFVSYTQQLNSIRPFSLFPRERQSAVYQGLCNRLVRWITTVRVRASFRRQVIAANRTSVKAEKQWRAAHNEIVCIATSFQLLWKHEPDNPAAVSLLDDAGQVDGWFIVESGDLKHRDGTRGCSGSVWVPIQMVERRRWLWALAVVWTWATTSFATDYLVPVGLGLAPPAIAAWSYLADKARRHAAAGQHTAAEHRS